MNVNIQISLKEENHSNEQTTTPKDQRAQAYKCACENE